MKFWKFAPTTTSTALITLTVQVRFIYSLIYYLCDPPVIHDNWYFFNFLLLTHNRLDGVLLDDEQQQVFSIFILL